MAVFVVGVLMVLVLMLLLVMVLRTHMPLPMVGLSLPLELISVQLLMHAPEPPVVSARATPRLLSLSYSNKPRRRS